MNGQNGVTVRLLAVQVQFPIERSANASPTTVKLAKTEVLTLRKLNHVVATFPVEFVLGMTHVFVLGQFGLLVQQVVILVKNQEQGGAKLFLQSRLVSIMF